MVPFWAKALGASQSGALGAAGDGSNLACKLLARQISP
jgi:hypothetical protein